MHLRVFVKKKSVVGHFDWMIYLSYLIMVTAATLSFCVSKTCGRTHYGPSQSTRVPNLNVDDSSYGVITTPPPPPPTAASFKSSNTYLKKLSASGTTTHCSFNSQLNRLSCWNMTSFYELQKLLDHPEHWRVLHSSETNDGSRNAVSFTDVISLEISFCHFGSDFNFKLLNNFSNVTQLVLRKNNFSEGKMAAPLPSIESQLEQLDLSSNNLVRLPSKAFKEFPNLQTINLSNNNITALDEDLFVSNTKLKNIYLRGNPLSCNEIQGFLKWIQRSNGVVVRESDKVNCDYYVNGEIFATTTFENLIDQCPANCTCLQFRAFVQVDCRNKGYWRFPSVLPNATNALHMENNHIDSFQSLLNGSNYASVRFLYVDNNSIDSINILERTDLFYALQAFYISGNRLTKLPTHMIERRMMDFLDNVKLGNNPWNCECKVVAPFHDLLLTHYKRIQDIDQVRCSNDGPHPNEVIHRLSKNDFCATYGTINPLDIVNVSLIVLILLIIGKVLYDYRTLKRTGQIPLGPLNWCGYPKNR